MIKQRFELLVAALFAACLLLSACGGGSSDDTDDADEKDDNFQSQQGAFVDAPVAGLSFETGSATGTTDEEGRFTFAEGAQVRFFIGGIELGSAEGDDIVTPIDLVDGATDANNPTVTNIIRFVQTLDDDGNPDNGIQITELVRDMASGRIINFSQSVQEFESDSEVVAVLDELTAATSAGARIIVSENAARTHFTGSLARLENESGLESDVADGDEISAEDAIAIFRDRGAAVYRISSEIDFTSTVENVGSLGFDYMNRRESAVSGVIAFASEGSAEFIDSCLGGRIVPEDAIEPNPDVVGNDGDGLCENPSLQYYRIGANGFGATYQCDGETQWASEFVYLDDGATFQQGSLSFTSAQFDNLARTDEVCGSISETTITNFGAPDDVAINRTDTQWFATVSAPYQDDERVSLIMTFSGPLEAGNYVIDPGNWDADIKSVTANLQSSTLGYRVGLSGSVVVDSVSDLVIAGSYDIETDTGDRVQGDFDLDMTD